MKRIILKKGKEKKARLFSPWFFDNEIEKVLADAGSSVPAQLLPGEIADIESINKEYIGRAFVNPNSKITARLFSSSKEGVDKGFFKAGIKKAIEARLPFYNLQKDCARLVFAEADFLPALIIDRYVDALSFKPYIVIQFLCYGIDMRRMEILEALDEVMCYTKFISHSNTLEFILGKPAGIIEKFSPKMRELEGLEDRLAYTKGDLPQAGIVIEEGQIKMKVDLSGGQKTGHFLDQKENHNFLQHLVRPGMKVLDCFCYTGGFSLNAAIKGAGVTSVDTSKAALDILKENAKLNNVEGNIQTVNDDVFDFLHFAQTHKELYDIIILDPPAFTKSHTGKVDASRAYKDINISALKCIKKNGILVTCSCSQAVNEYIFKSIIKTAAIEAKRRIVQIDFRFQAKDHPILIGHEESEYLKCGVYKVV